VPSTHFEFKKRVVARLQAVDHSHQKVYDVVEESTTNNWQEHTAHDLTHPIATAAFPSCVAPASAVRDQKVYDVVEESTTNTWQEHTAHDTTHPIATAAFPSCAISREVAIKQRIYAALVASYPTLKPYQAEKAAASYVDVMLEEMAESIRRFGYEDDQISLALDKVSARIGRVKVGGKDVKVCGAVNKDRHNALIHVDFEGQVGRNSRVSINPRYQGEIDLAIAASKSHAISSGGSDKAPNIYTRVDPGMLDSFVENTSQAHDKAWQNASPDNEKYRKTLLRNLLHAKHIKASLVEEGGQCLFPEYWEQSDSGRCYGHGTSLQRVSKEVRHAALGRCHMYDFKAASYALMTDLALYIDPTLEVGVLKDYVNRRSQIRKAIAADVGISEDRIKAIFTSLGFGAKIANNPFASIRKTLGEAAYNRLMINHQFVRIGDAMIMVREAIAGSFSDSFEFFGRQYNPVCPRTGKKRTKSQKLAWLYQAMEADAITRFGAGAAEAGYQPLLFVHDCVYFKHKLPEGVLATITENIRQMFPLLEADHDDIFPIHAPDFVDAVYAQEDQRIREHQKLMRQLNGQAVAPKAVMQPETSPWLDDFAYIMSMNDLPELPELVAGSYSLGTGIDLGRSWSMAAR